MCFLIGLILYTSQVDADCRITPYKTASCEFITSKEIQQLPNYIESLSISDSTVNVIIRSTFAHLADTLKYLTCDNCNISEIRENAFKGFGKLRLIELGNIKLMKIHPSFFSDLHYLIGVSRHCYHFPYNTCVCKNGSLEEIQKIPFGIHHLEIEDIPVNRITQSTFWTCSYSLISLKCNNCNITNIDDDAFERFRVIEFLDLKHNKLTKLKTIWFKTTSNLKELNLSFNNVSSCVEYELFGRKYLGNVNITNNPYLEKSCLDIITAVSDKHCRRPFKKMYFCYALNLIDITKFPSDILYLVIRDAPLYNIKKSVFSRFAATLVTFQCNNCSISIIEDNAFNGFRNLTNLDFNNNNLTKLNFSLFKNIMNLRYLDLRSNSIRNCVDAKSLLAISPLTTIYIDRNPHLNKACLDAIIDKNTRYCNKSSGEKYVCKGISSRDIIKLPNNIRHLEISDSAVNKITRVIFKSFATTIESLQCINCSISKIEDNAFSGFEKLKVLGLRNNKLTAFNFSLFKDIANLEELDLSMNNISSCDDINSLSVLKPLVTTYIDNNPHIEQACSVEIKDINKDLCEQPYEDIYFCNGINSTDIAKLSSKIRHFEISKSTVNIITQSTFSRFAEHLNYFQCNGCNISEIESNAFDGFWNLKSLDLKNNKLTKLNASITKDTANLKYLDLRSNNISSCFNIKHLLALVPFITIYIDSNPYLEKFCLDAIVGINTRHCNRFSDEKYVCKGIDLKDIIKLPDNIHHLEISDSAVEMLTRGVFTRFADTLESLQCNNCGIFHIEDNTFRKFHNLKYLNLENNKLTKLKPIWFTETLNLRELNLHSNNISSCLDFDHRLMWKHLRNINMTNKSYLEGSCFNKTTYTSGGYCEKYPGKKYFCNGISSEDITKLPSDIRYLVIHDASFGSIKKSMFSHLGTALSTFHCNNFSINDIENNTFDGFKNLSNLELINNRLTKLNFSLFKDTVNLRYLNLRYNNISGCVDTESLLALTPFITIYVDKNLYLEKPCLNAIMNINAKHCNEFSERKYVCKGVSSEDIMKLPNNIYHLKISDSVINAITSDVFTRFADTLKSLQCNNCSIFKIEDNIFERFKKLEFLDLSDNKLTHLNISLFNEISNLRHLDLRSNDISNFVYINILPSLRPSIIVYVDNISHLV